jgi:hypothetical protein
LPTVQKKKTTLSTILPIMQCGVGGVLCLQKNYSLSYLWMYKNELNKKEQTEGGAGGEGGAAT